MQAAPATKPQRLATAFSLVELVLVLAIMAIITALAVPRYSSSVARYRADAAARRIASDMSLLQSRAYGRNALQSATFSVSSNTYQLTEISDPNHPSQPYIIKLSDPPYFATLTSVNFAGGNTISFDAFGQPTPTGTIVITVGVERRTIIIDPSSGRAKVQ